MARLIKMAHRQGDSEFLDLVKAAEVRPLKRVRAVFLAFKLPSAVKDKVLVVLLNDLSYRHYLRAAVEKASLQWERAEVKKAKLNLKQMLLRRLARPLLPPANLRERMTRELVEPLVEYHDILSQLLSEKETKIKEVKRSFTAVRKRGKQTREAIARLKTILKDTKWSARKTAKFVFEILKAWNPAIAPESAESVRVSSIRLRTKKRLNSPL